MKKLLCFIFVFFINCGWPLFIYEDKDIFYISEIVKLQDKSDLCYFVIDFQRIDKPVYHNFARYVNKCDSGIKVGQKVEFKVIR